MNFKDYCENILSEEIILNEMIDEKRKNQEEIKKILKKHNIKFKQVKEFPDSIVINFSYLDPPSIKQNDFQIIKNILNIQNNHFNNKRVYISAIT